MIEIIEVKNPFEPNKREVSEIYCTGGKLTDYIDIDGKDIFIDGHAIEHPDQVTPIDGMQIIVMPHIAGKGVKSVLGLVAMVALSAWSGGIAAHGIWGIAGKTLGSYLVSGAVMFLGGKLINSVFPQDASKFNTKDHEQSRSYGWDVPTPVTTAGYVVGETYGECIPAPQLLEQHVETINDKQYLNLLYCGGYGPVDSIDNIRIDKTPIGNFSNVEIETRLGTNDQEPISFFKNTPLDQSVGLSLDTDLTLTRTSNSPKASALEITLEWPAGLYRMNDDGSYADATVKFQAEYRRTGTDKWNTFQEDGEPYEVTAATNTALRRTFQVSGLDAAQYDVRVTMIDRPNTSRYQTSTEWTILTSYVDGIYSRPNKVLVALRILASNQLSNGVPSVNWRQCRKHVWVYDPDDKQYVEKSADNPIWATYDILHGCRRLLNINTHQYDFSVAGYPHEAFDAYWDEWKSAAAYADEEIRNSDGELEPRFRFDAFFDTTEKRWDAAQKAATVGHAAIIMHGRNIGIVVDRPGRLTQIFGEGRTTVSSVKGTFSSREDRARAVEITYSDEHNDFKNTMMTIRSPNYAKGQASDNTAQITLFGVKRRSQAYREAVHALATNERQLQFIELGADIDAIVAEYGDIVGYNHAVSRIGIASGRVVSATLNTVELDKEITLELGKSYEIYFTLSDDSLVKRDVVAKEYTGNVLELSTPFDDGQIPERFDNYAFGETDKAIKPFRVVAATRDGDMKVKLKLAEYDEAMYSTELDYSKYPVVEYADSPSVAHIIKVTASEESYLTGGAAVSDVSVSWEVENGKRWPDSFHVEILSTSGSYHEQLSTRLTSCLFHNVKAGEEYEIVVRCVMDAITVDHATTIIYINGKALPADNVANLRVIQVGGGLQLSWSPSRMDGVAGYNIYRGDAGAGTSMENCSLISAGVTDSLYLDEQDNAGTWSYWVVAVDANGKQIGTAIDGVGKIVLPGKLTDVSVDTIYRHYEDGSTGYDIVARFKPPKGTEGQIYYKTNHVDMTEISVIPEGVPADEIGFTANWRYAGSGVSTITIPAAQLGDIYRLKLVARDYDGWESSAEDAVYQEVEIKAKTVVPNTPQNFKADFQEGGKCVFSWSDVTNSDVDLYELRMDENPGATIGLLARVQGTNATVTLKARNGTIYLYAHNTTKKYSFPATITYNYDKPLAPEKVEFEEIPRGIRIRVPSWVSPIKGVRFYLTSTDSSDVIYSTNPDCSYLGVPGIYSVRAVYIDVFGEGFASPEYSVTINPTFNPEWIEDGSISLQKMDITVSAAVKDAQDSVPKIEGLDKKLSDANGKIAELVKTTDSITSTIAANKQNQDGINEQLATQIQQTADTVSSTVQKRMDGLGEDVSQLKQTASQISSTVQANKTAADKSLSNLSSKITQNANAITSVVTELGKSPDKSSYSAITQLLDGINLRVKKDDVINQINMTAKGTRISGQYLDIDAETRIGNNIITNNMIKSGAISADKIASKAITADKLNVTSLSALSATIGTLRTKTTGARCEISDNLICVYDENNTLRVKMGVW